MEGFNAWTWCVLDLETQPPWLVVGGMAFPGAPSAPSFCLLIVLLETSLFLICQCQISSFSWAIVWVSSKVMYLRLGCWASPKSHVHQLLARTLSTDPFSLRKARFLQKWIVMRCYDKTGKEGRWSDEEASDQQKKGSNRDMNETKTKAGKR